MWLLVLSNELRLCNEFDLPWRRHIFVLVPHQRDAYSKILYGRPDVKGIEYHTKKTSLVSSWDSFLFSSHEWLQEMSDVTSNYRSYWKTARLLEFFYYVSQAIYYDEPVSSPRKTPLNYNHDHGPRTPLDLQGHMCNSGCIQSKLTRPISDCLAFNIFIQRARVRYTILFY